MDLKMLNQEIHFYEEIMYLTSEKVISGFKDGSFKPNDTVTRAQVAIMIGRALDLNGTNVKLNLMMFPLLYALVILLQLLKKELLEVLQMDRIIHEPVTRGQMAIFLDRAFDIKRGTNKYI